MREHYWLPAKEICDALLEHASKEDEHLRELSARQPGMMSLISLALIVAFTASIAATLGFFEVDVWWELATLVSVMLLGHWLEMKATAQARGALDALAALLPDSAERVTDA